MTTTFPKLTNVTCTEKNGKFIYTGTFADGSIKIIRSSAKRFTYKSVAQVVRFHEPYGTNPARWSEDFVFGGTTMPTIHKFQRKWVSSIVQIGI
jgi:hypothetical protein